MTVEEIIARANVPKPSGTGVASVDDILRRANAPATGGGGEVIPDKARGAIPSFLMGLGSGSSLGLAPKNVGRALGRTPEQTTAIRDVNASENPLSYYGGEIAGNISLGLGTGGLGLGLKAIPALAKLGKPLVERVASGIGKLGPSVAPVVKAQLGNTAQSAITGWNEGNTLSEKVKGGLMGGVTSFGLGAGTSPLIGGIQKLLAKGFAPGAIMKGGTTFDDLEKYKSDPRGHDNALPIWDRDNPNLVDKFSGYAEDVKQAGIGRANSAYDILKLGGPESSVPFSEVDEALRSKLKANRGPQELSKEVGEQQKALQGYIDTELPKAYGIGEVGSVPQQLPSPMSLYDLSQAKLKVGKDIDWDKKGAGENQASKDVYGVVNDIVRRKAEEANLPYRQMMKHAEPAAELSKELKDLLSDPNNRNVLDDRKISSLLERNISGRTQSDTETGLIHGIGNILPDNNLLQELDYAGRNKRFGANQIRGSFLPKALEETGKAIGVPSGVMGMIGGLKGSIGGPIAKQIMSPHIGDTYAKDIIDAVDPRFKGILSDALTRGTAAFATTLMLIQQKDPAALQGIEQGNNQ